MTRLPFLSVIIPTLDAAAHLPILLPRLEGAGEIIVVDGGSSDGTVERAREAGVRLVAAPRGRGVQLRAGAEAARGDWLLFLHADTLPAPSWGEAVADHRREAPGRAGYFRLRLASSAWQARLIEQGVALRCRWLGLPYGDQGLLVSRSLYGEIGGYRPLPIMEDVDLARRLGPRRLVALDVDAWTSAARWRRDGWWRRSARNLMCLSLWRAGVDADRIARLYG